jgi:riboflavin kinase / FMN adenylyltransferase
MDLRGTVALGDKRGRSVGFPTTNLNGAASEACGDYAPQTRIAGDDKAWPLVTSNGTQLTFDGADQRIETRILYFQGDIYGCEIEVRLLAFIWPELRFELVGALITAIQGDIEQAPGDQRLRTIGRIT